MNLPAQALLLAAGKSTRIAAVSGGLPKPLLQVGGRSVLEHALNWVVGSGVREVWINLHHEAEQVRATVGDGAHFDAVVRYSYEPVLLGTAGAWKKLEAQWSGPSLVIYADNLMRFDLAALAAAHAAAGTLATVALFDPERHAHTGVAGGRAELDSGGTVRGFVEGGESGLVNAGAYVLNPEVGEWISQGFQDFGQDVLPRLAAAGAVHGHVLEGSAFCLGIDTPPGLERARRMWSAGEVVV